MTSTLAQAAPTARRTLRDLAAEIARLTGEDPSRVQASLSGQADRGGIATVQMSRGHHGHRGSTRWVSADEAARVIGVYTASL